MDSHKLVCFMSGTAVRALTNSAKLEDWAHSFREVERGSHGIFLRVKRGFPWTPLNYRDIVVRSIIDMSNMYFVAELAIRLGRSIAP
jgi:hypothetical protein